MASEPTRAVLAAIPHRPPFLFVDRIVERGPSTIVTEWHVPHDLECFEGHYPGQPVLPGVIACEFAFQSAAIFFGDPSAERAPRGAVPVLARIDDARFKRIVQPGETLRAEVEIEESLSNARYLRARVSSAGRTVMQLKFVVALSQNGSLATSATGVESAESIGGGAVGGLAAETGAQES